MKHDETDQFAVLDLMCALEECDLLPGVPNRGKAGLAELKKSALKSEKGHDFVAVYRSTSRISDQAELKRLLDNSKANNARLNISGIMLHYDDNFFQVIEGEEQVVRDLLEKIENDPRHTMMDVVYIRDGHRRVFPDWTMEMIDISPDEFEALMLRLPDTGSMSKEVFSSMGFGS